MKKITPKEISNIRKGQLKSIENYALNQIVLWTESGSIFFSYGKVIGEYINGELYLTQLHDYSKTTSKYCTKWCGLTTKQRREGLQSGLYTLISE